MVMAIYECHHPQPAHLLTWGWSWITSNKLWQRSTPLHSPNTHPVYAPHS